MKQLTLAAVGFEHYAKTTRRAGFLAEMERVVPWPVLCARIEPFYPKPGNGRPPVPTRTSSVATFSKELQREFRVLLCSRVSDRLGRAQSSSQEGGARRQSCPEPGGLG
jgi:hypothetical protein